MQCDSFFLENYVFSVYMYYTHPWQTRCTRSFSDAFFCLENIYFIIIIIIIIIVKIIKAIFFLSFFLSFYMQLFWCIFCLENIYFCDRVIVGLNVVTAADEGKLPDGPDSTVWATSTGCGVFQREVLWEIYQCYSMCLLTGGFWMVRHCSHLI